MFQLEAMEVRNNGCIRYIEVFYGISFNDDFQRNQMIFCLFILQI